LHANQLRTADGTVNKMPVAYVSSSLGADDRQLAAQYLIGGFMGIGESELAGSYLNARTTAATTGRGYFVQNGSGKPRFDDDAQALYGFALVYRNVLGAADLESLQHFGDQLHPSDVAQDPDLSVPAGSAAVKFVDAFGSAQIEGARVVGDTLSACVQNESGVAIDDERIKAYFAFAAPDQADSVVGILHAREAAFALTASVVSENCQLLVAFKNGTQYPFATNRVNGLYAREGSVKDKAGQASPVPVIYLNASILELDPAAQASSAKPVTLVLQHEFAHFLGFKHAASAQSIMAPAGYNAKWDLAGGDDKLFDAYLTLWRASR
jgi:hypothetical protein